MKKELFKKFLVMVLVICTIVATTGCASKKSDENNTTSTEPTTAAQSTSTEKKQIKFFHRFPDEPFNSFIESKIAEYEAANPDIDIVVTSAQNDPYKEKIKVVVGTNDCPDIFFSKSDRSHVVL